MQLDVGWGFGPFRLSQRLFDVGNGCLTVILLPAYLLVLAVGLLWLVVYLPSYGALWLAERAGMAISQLEDQTKLIVVLVAVLLLVTCCTGLGIIGLVYAPPTGP